MTDIIEAMELAYVSRVTKFIDETGIITKENREECMQDALRAALEAAGIGVTAVAVIRDHFSTSTPPALINLIDAAYTESGDD